MFHFGNSQKNYFGIKLADNLVLALAVLFIESAVETALESAIILNFTIKHNDNLMYLVNLRANTLS